MHPGEWDEAMTDDNGNTLRYRVGRLEEEVKEGFHGLSRKLDEMEKGLENGFVKARDHEDTRARVSRLERWVLTILASLASITLIYVLRAVGLPTP